MQCHRAYIHAGQWSSLWTYKIAVVWNNIYLCFVSGKSWPWSSTLCFPQTAQHRFYCVFVIGFLYGKTESCMTTHVRRYFFFFFFNWKKKSKNIPWGQSLQTSPLSSPASCPTRWHSCQKIQVITFKTNNSVQRTITFRFNPLSLHDTVHHEHMMEETFLERWLGYITQHYNLPEVKLALVKFDQHFFAVLHNELHINRLRSVIPHCCCRLPSRGMIRV